MSKKSRARLWISILTCEGLFATLAERVQFPPGPAKFSGSVLPDELDSAAESCRDYAGAIHIHSTYSDGLGSVKDIAAAAARAGLDFVVLNDHSNLDAITNGENGRHGSVLVSIGTEVTTDHGHLLAMNVPPSILPASNDAIVAQKAIQEVGGYGFIALPCDLKDHWRDFSARRDQIGLEVFNLSAIARAKISLPGFLLAWLRYKGHRPQRAFHWIAARPTRELRLWDELTAQPAPGASTQRVVGIGSLDAHGVMKVARRQYPFPTYEELFRTLRTHIVTDQLLQNLESCAAEAAVNQALSSGHAYIAYDNFGNAGGFMFRAVMPGATKDCMMGDCLTLATEGSHDGRVVLQISAPKRRSIIHIVKDGKRILTQRGNRVSLPVDSPGVYRAEVYLYRHRIGRLCMGVKPWIFSNPIYVSA